MSIAWSASFATGVAEIDRQHQELLEHVGTLLDVMDREPAAVGRALDFLGDYTVSHFETEERLMEHHAYPQAQAHRDAHAGFVRTFGRLRFDYDLDGLTEGMSELIGGWMVDWLKHHILEMDRALGRFLLGAQASAASVTVMPCTPSADSASRTSSSLKGLMMAVTSFIMLPF